MPREDRYPNWLFPAAIAFSAPFFIPFWYFESNNLRALLAALSAGTIFVTVATLWNLRTYLTFWMIMVLDVLGHVLLLFSIKGTSSHFPAAIFMPIMIADLLLWQFITVRAINLLRF
jgi:hypothetical protein